MKPLMAMAAVAARVGLAGRRARRVLRILVDARVWKKTEPCLRKHVYACLFNSAHMYTLWTLDATLAFFSFFAAAAAAG